MVAPVGQLPNVEFQLDDHLQRFGHRIGVGMQPLVAQYGPGVGVDSQSRQPVGDVRDFKYSIVFGATRGGDDLVARLPGAFGSVADASKAVDAGSREDDVVMDVAVVG